MSSGPITTASKDAIYVQSMTIEATVGLDAWQQRESQPVMISATVYKDTAAAAENDDFTKTLDYRSIYGQVRAIGGKSYKDVFDLALHLASAIANDGEKGISKDGELEIVLQKAILRCEGGVVLKCSWGTVECNSDGLLIVAICPVVVALRNIKLSCIIGINDDERVKRQHITMDLEVFGKSNSTFWQDLPSIFDGIINYVEASNCQTVEALANWTARKMIEEHQFSSVTISIRKSNVFAHSQGPGVRITRRNEPRLVDWGVPLKYHAFDG